MTYLETAAARIATAVPISLYDYWTALDGHDWTPGTDPDELEALRSQATLSDRHATMFVLFQQHHNAKAFNRGFIPPLPDRPLLSAGEIDREAREIQDRDRPWSLGGRP